MASDFAPKLCRNCCLLMSGASQWYARTKSQSRWCGQLAKRFISAPVRLCRYWNHVTQTRGRASRCASKRQTKALHWTKRKCKVHRTQRGDAYATSIDSASCDDHSLTIVSPKSVGTRSPKRRSLDWSGRVFPPQEFTAALRLEFIRSPADTHTLPWILKHPRIKKE
jgi:hypothetical protein